MKLSLQVASTSQTINVFVQDSSSTVGAGMTGMLFNAAGMTAYYMLPRAAAAVITLVTQTVTGAWTSGGFIEISAANCPGWYRFDIPDAAIASGRFSNIHLKGGVNMAPVPIEIELTGWNNQDAVRGGMTGIPNVAAGALGGLPLSVDTAGRVDVLKLNGTTQTARDIGASVLLSPGVGTGQVSLTSGLVTLAAVTHTGARIPNVTLTDTVTTYTANTPQSGDNFARLGAPAGLSVSADVAAIRTDYTTARAVKIDNLDAAISTRTKPADTQAAVTTLTTYTGNTPQTGDGYARLGAPAGLSHAADIAAVKADSGGLRTDYTTVRAGYLDTLNGLVAATWNALTSGMATAGSVGKRISDFVTGDAFVRLGAPAGASVSADILALPTATVNANGLLDLANGVETAITIRQAMRVQLAAAAGKVDGAATTTMHLRNQADTVNRVTAVVDASGNRTGITLDLT